MLCRFEPYGHNHMVVVVVYPLPWPLLMASSALTQAGSVHKSRDDNVVRMWHSGNGCVLASTLCKYTLMKGDLFVQGWARVRGVRRGSISS